PPFRPMPTALPLVTVVASHATLNVSVCVSADSVAKVTVLSALTAQLPIVVPRYCVTNLSSQVITAVPCGPPVQRPLAATMSPNTSVCGFGLAPLCSTNQLPIGCATVGCSLNENASAFFMKPGLLASLASDAAAFLPDE